MSDRYGWTKTNTALTYVPDGTELGDGQTVDQGGAVIIGDPSQTAEACVVEGRPHELIAFAQRIIDTVNAASPRTYHAEIVTVASLPDYDPGVAPLQVYETSPPGLPPQCVAKITGGWTGDWDDNGPIFADADELLAAAGWTRNGDWDGYPWGYRCTVERASR